MTYEEILELVQKEEEKNPDDFYLEEFAGGYYDIEGLENIEVVHSTGGCDKGSNWVRVVYFKDHDVYIKFQGYYSSYDGADVEWSGVSQVFPKQETITVYK